MTPCPRIVVRVVAVAALVGASLVSAQRADGQLAYQTGQNVSPAYEGWIQNDDGSKTLVFGYMNRNWSEELDVPVGENNFFSPGPEDRGQPTHFRPRRNRFVFMVTVPADFDEELVWTLTTQGQTERAYGTLGIDQALDDIVIASETGALGIGASNAEIRANQAPVITIESGSEYSVRVGQPVELAVRMEDDGLVAAYDNWVERQERAAAAEAEREGPPRLNRTQLRPPTRITVQKAVWHHVAWFLYRSDSDGTPTFDPPQVKTWEDTRTGANSPWAPLWTRTPIPEDGMWRATVTFDQPGTYILRARGDDGALYHDQDVTIVVSAIASQQDG
ncbi:MAG: hypothetical protein OXU33_12045 [Gemmatimonadota bacterium]|nr:hypothetical protein [Gemmatimonadota bacterium]MDE3005025.1 hypothetical protein [Gemmatimonadota bacterium]MDE3014795.1 hypothetical protein [Gemmatimonadota bacterium]